MSEYSPTVTDMRMSMINRGYTEAQVSELLGQIKADVWDDAYGTGVSDAWTSMDYDGGMTPAARVNPYRSAS